jgi:hypothetical protein
MIVVTKFQFGSWDFEGNHSSRPDSTGGVSVKVAYKNLSETKTIKYMRIKLTPLNAVKDVVQSEFSHQNGVIQDVGPVEPGAAAGGGIWESLWYNHSITDVRIDYAEIEYMDGSIETQQNVTVDPSQGPQDSGCYVATSIYESYDCPPVWVLRRFRDESLANTGLGRKFISTYYLISPRLVDLLGNSRVFKSAVKPLLNTLVRTLTRRGYSDFPYLD